MQLNLTGKVALVTGGASGIGAGISEALAAEGVDLALSYRAGRLDHVANFAERISDKHRVRALPVAGDLTCPGDISRLIEQVIESFSRIDILVNNAGVWPTEDFMQIDRASWSEVLDTCLTGPAFLAQSAAAEMIRQGDGGQIVNISSKSSFQYNTSGHAHYAVAKAGLNMLTRSLAKELAPHAIRAIGVAPGMVATPINEEKWQEPGAREQYEQRIPVGRFAEAREIGDLVAFLVSERATNINGTTIDTTGGMLI